MRTAARSRWRSLSASARSPSYRRPSPTSRRLRRPSRSSASRPPTWEDRDRLVGLNLDLTEHGGPGFVEVVVHGGLDRQRLTAAGFTWTVQVPDLALTTAQSNRKTAAYAASVATSPLPSGRDTYRTLADYERDLDALASAYPGHVKALTLPTRPTKVAP
jgi:hypothetical protein